MTVNNVPPEILPVPPTPHSPNSDLPVIVYRGALNDLTFEGALAAIDTREWPKGGHWKIGGEILAATPHYHAITHEAYTVLHGSGTYLLGKSPLDPDTNAAGNPAGVTHYVTETEDEYEIIGFYSLVRISCPFPGWKLDQLR
ncbi:hypothetical protein FE257_011897 [Aspergillus nanangensis]|uniref:Uncharacterized protein n=1 Tax=Aspergillus nanangensis TaxID=2582783 RepID=A0AAD4CGX5_ASPNN|nr:hypothetical protein FE257_011897 [Aspergillus nanangensis]